MTWAQTTFAYCFLVMVPVAGILFAKRRRQQGRSRVKGFFLGSGAMCLAMVGCCFLAHGLFPQYPTVPVSEWLANAFTLPAILCILGMLWFPRPSPEHKRLIVRWTNILLVIYIGGMALTYRMNLWPARAALPWNAREIKEEIYSDWGDYDYRMSASISKEQFREYVTNFKLQPGHDPFTFRSGTDDAGMTVTYEDGYIRVHAWHN